MSPSVSGHGYTGRMILQGQMNEPVVSEIRLGMHLIDEE